MATKIVSYANLQKYDELIKTYIGNADSVVDAKSIKNVAVVGDNIYFFKQDVIPTTESGDVDITKASAHVAIASSDIAQLKADVEELQGTVVGYSSTNTVASAIAAAEQAAKDYTDELANGQVKTNKEDIEAINDEATGILAQAKGYTDDEIAKLDATVTNVVEGETAPDVQITVVEADGKLTSVSATVTAERFDAYGAAAAVQGDTTETVASVDGKVSTINTTLGDMTAVKTTAKTVAGAVDELFDAIDSAEEAGEVTLTTAETATEGYLKTYVISQGGDEVGKIDIPKDLVVKSGEVVVNPEGKPEGTYIKLIIANDEETPIYIDVKTLVDIYKGAEGATQVQITVDGYTISAAIVAGGVGTTELADGAVTTAKIADENVTLGKLAQDVQASLGLADSALQAEDITTGEANGTIAVEGTDVAVKGLESAAFVTVASLNATAEGYADDAEAAAKQYADDLYEIASADDINGLFVDKAE